MKKTILATSLAIGLALTLVATATAHDWKLSADIPFSFNVGDVEMNSGKYTVNIIGNGVVSIRSAENQKAAISLSNAMITPRNLKAGRLVFNLYGNQYFLSSVSWPEGPSRMLPPTDVEVQVAKNVAGQRRLALAAQ